MPEDNAGNWEPKDLDEAMLWLCEESWRRGAQRLVDGDCAQKADASKKYIADHVAHSLAHRYPECGGMMGRREVLERALEHRRRHRLKRDPYDGGSADAFRRVLLRVSDSELALLVEADETCEQRDG